MRDVQWYRHFQKTNSEPIEIDKDPILLDHSQVKALESLVSDVLNQKISPDTLAESPDLDTVMISLRLFCVILQHESTGLMSAQNVRMLVVSRRITHL